MDVYPHRLRFACVGDAVVGMHPVTAHGFNFGLLGIDKLAAISAQATCCWPATSASIA